jgi:hypothetical protein
LEVYNNNNPQNTISSGTITGHIIHHPRFLGDIPEDEIFKDDDFWHLPYAVDDTHLVIMPPTEDSDHEHHDEDHEEFARKMLGMLSSCFTQTTS